MPMRLPFMPALLVTLGMLLSLTGAWAQGTVTHLSGPVSVLKADGKTVPGVAGTQVAAGDTVVTGPAGFVRVAMTDGGEMVIRPDSQLKIDSYKFVNEAPAEDNFVFSMLKGGFRAITGKISKRGNPNAYKLNTPTATMGIRGTQFDVRVCQANCGALPSGTYVAVTYGSVQAGNAQGSLNLRPGQVAYVPRNSPPVLLPRNPGIGFTPPPEIPKLDEKKKQAEEKASVEEKVAAAAKADTAPPSEPKEGTSATESQTPSSTDSTSTTAAAAECVVQ